MLLAAPSLGGSGGPQSTALWRVVHDLCVTDKRTIGLPAPCTAVDLRKGIAIVKDAGGATGYLVVPTKRLAGIEDPALLAGEAPNYWQLAWDARGFVARKASRRLDRTDIGIAVNSIAGRSQDQLHLHIDCVGREVRAGLASLHPQPNGSWTGLEMSGHAYRVTAIRGADLGLRNPFKMLADSEALTSQQMGQRTLVVVGAKIGGDDGFYVVKGGTGPKSNGHGEELLDHRCAIARA